MINSANLKGGGNGEFVLRKYSAEYSDVILTVDKFTGMAYWNLRFGMNYA